MPSTDRSRRGSRGIARVLRGAGEVAIVTSLLLFVGRSATLADPLEDHPGNGAGASQAGSANGPGHADPNGRANGHDDLTEVAPTASADASTATTDTLSGSDEASDTAAGSASRGAQPFSDPAHLSKITICHATGSARNPYVVITVAREAADGIAGNSGNRADHYGEHEGPIFDPAIHSNGGGWGDVIPDVDDDGHAMPHDGMNWGGASKAFLADGCEAAPVQVAEISVLIEKTNDANQDGIFTDFEEARTEDQDVTFQLVITNTSDETVAITDLTDAFEQTTIDLLDVECASLGGAVLGPGESTTCVFTLPGYSPAADTTLTDVARVCVEIVGGVETACDTNPSRVGSAIVLGRTVTPPPGQQPRTETPPGAIAFTGPSVALPLILFALVLFVLGTGLLRAGYRRSGSR